MMRKRQVLDFGKLVEGIRQVHERCAAHACKAVNASLTFRNWMIGYYIAEFELRGEDRAVYGEQLFGALSAALRKVGVINSGRRQLYGYLSFFRTYPRIVRTLPAQFKRLLPAPGRTDKKVRTVSAQLMPPAQELTAKLSYSHLENLVALEDPLKRAFYEFECMRGNWSVRELKRQIGSLFFERSGLSKNKKKLAELVRAGAEVAGPQLAIRDPYVFEFLGIKAKEIMGESDIEDCLLDKLQEFLLELGHGFCFEARQKRILIGSAHGFVDMVFYHRVLKCHVLIELKLAEFTHEHLGQLNTYVSWYKRNMMSVGDNPPVGILLCTGKDHAMVEYALADIPNRLFVSKYQVELPRRDEIQRFLDAQLKEAGEGRNTRS